MLKIIENNEGDGKTKVKLYYKFLIYFLSVRRFVKLPTS